MSTHVGTLLGLLLWTSVANGGPAPKLPEQDRIRIAEAFHVAEAVGNRLWPGWDQAPFAVLLVTPEYEFLIRHPKPSGDFTLIGDDTLLNAKVWYRRRRFPTHLLATFPAVGEVPTVVIGQPENTASKTSTRWVITLLHEHFHQLQNAQPGYYADVKALGLAQGDRTGMWMLNYPFPYSEPPVKEQFSLLGRALAEALHHCGQADFPAKLDCYLQSKQKFESLLKPHDAAYLAFQFWQEGIARYTEYHLAELAARDYQPSQSFRNLADYTPFGEVARAIRQEMEKDLVSLQLDRAKRTVVYSFGAAEGLLLDCAHPGWRGQYFKEKFSLDRELGLKK